MGKLVAHIAQVQRWAEMTVRTRAKERLSRDDLPGPPAEAQLVGWFREATAALLATLAATEPTTPVWTFTPDGTAAFWARRQAQEVAVHRWDAEDAAGGAAALSALLARDGIDELLEILPCRAGERFIGAGESIHLHCLDVQGEWLVRLGPKGLGVEHSHQLADAAARGSASDLDLFLWGRLPADRLEVFGDRALLDRFQTLTAL
jgi:uncharacterized protein (TIGR03083 family)